MRKLFISFLAIISVVAFASEPTENSPSASTKTFNFSGKVVESISGETLAGVEIEILNTGNSVYTDFDGNFEIEGLILNQEYTLHIKYVSYKKKIIRINNKEQDQILIKLKNNQSPVSQKVLSVHSDT
jgi:hypothetical protein